MDPKPNEAPNQSTSPTTSPSVVNPENKPKKSHKALFFLLGILIVLVLVGGIGGGYFLGKNSTSSNVAQAPTPTIAQDMTGSNKLTPGEPKINDAVNLQTIRVYIKKDYSFDLTSPTVNYFSITIPLKYSLDTKGGLYIYNEQKRNVLYIYNYAGGESSPVGSKIIDDVPFTLDYYKDIQCLSDLGPTNWKPGTQYLLGIHVNCDENFQATKDELNIYTKIIESLKFSPVLKKTLLGK